MSCSICSSSLECSFCSSSLHDVEDDEDDDGSAFASHSSVLVFLGADWALEAGVLQSASAEGAEDGEVVLFASATRTDEVDVYLCIGFNNAAANADSAQGVPIVHTTNPFLANCCFSWAWQICTNKVRDEIGERVGCTGIRPALPTAAIVCIMAARMSN